MAVPSYSSPFAVGHKAVADLFQGTVIIQEKVDGSQFSFGLNSDGDVECRSKGAQLHITAPDKMFAKGVETVLALKPLLRDRYTYRGEYLAKPKHNVLAYDRTPKGNVVLFDVEAPGQYYFTPEELAEEADRLGLESVPVLFRGEVKDPNLLRGLLDSVSILGGAKIEGVVVKNYEKFTEDKKAMMAKFVSEAFKEVHAGEWRAANPPTQGDVQTSLIAAYRTPARWAKAVQHLREAGTLEGAPRDIGALVKEVKADVEKECTEEIKDALFAHFWPHIARGLTGGLPEWYRDQLAAAALSD